MEQNFQTSFIPKKPIVKEHISAPRPIGFLTIISMFVVFTVLVVSGALYFYKGIAAKNITKMQSDLELAKNRFEPAKIAELQALDRRLSASSEILSKHIAISPIFESLSAITMKSVRYTKFAYTVGTEPNAKINVQMSGVTLGYTNLALQSDLFAKNKNFVDPVFSNLTLNEAGNVLFDLNFSVDPSFVDYKTVLQTI
jgi:hypothetical protein